MHPILLTTLLSTTAFAAPRQTAATLDLQQSLSEPTFEMRLERLVENMEKARASLHVAGMALAVVKDDQVVLTHGFGSADLEQKRAVTPETIFAIGSTTKAFTSALVGMLVDDGAMDWDDSITDYLPYFTLDTGEANADVTLRDLLSHRTGFTRMSALMLQPGVPSETILKTAAQAEPWAPFRKEFHYNNIMFLAAGVASGVAADSTWNTLIAERIFAPLGMNASSTTFAAGKASAELASGYLWDAEKGEYESKSMADIDGIGPAGSINSNVIDMAQWLRLQLGQGEIDGKRLISEDSLAATWTAQQQITGDVAYGFGWMLREWNGNKVVEHGGNIGGFAAQVAFLPGSNLGYVLLTNASVTALQGGSIPMVFDALLGPWESDDAVASMEELDYDAYVGNYIANFASFKDADFEVQIADGSLAIDVPGQQLYSLKNPTEEGRWHFALTDQIQVSFQRDAAGEVVGLTMHQGGFDFEAPREGVEIKGEIPVEDLQRFLGHYASEDGTVKSELVILNNRLAVDIPNQMTFELRPPDEDQRWQFRVRSVLAVSFNESEGGQVESMTIHEPGEEKELKHLVQDADSEDAVPTIDEIMTLRRPKERLAALEKAGSLRLYGTVRFANAGLEGKYEQLIADHGRRREHMDFGTFGVMTNTLNGDQAWSRNPMSGTEATDGEALRALALTHPSVVYGDWRDSFEVVSVLGLGEEDGIPVVRVRLNPENAPAQTMYVDLETGDVVRMDTVAISDLVNVPMVVRFEDFREVHGLRIPFRTTATNDWSGRIVTTLEDVEAGAEVDSELFQMPMDSSK